MLTRPRLLRALVLACAATVVLMLVGKRSGFDVFAPEAAWLAAARGVVSSTATTRTAVHGEDGALRPPPPAGAASHASPTASGLHPSAAVDEAPRSPASPATSHTSEPVAEALRSSAGAAFLSPATAAVLDPDLSATAHVPAAALSSSSEPALHSSSEPTTASAGVGRGHPVARRLHAHHAHCNLSFWIDIDGDAHGGSAVARKGSSAVARPAAREGSSVVARAGSTLRVTLHAGGSERNQDVPDMELVLSGPARTAGFFLPRAAAPDAAPATAVLEGRLQLPPLPGNYTLDLRVQFCSTEEVGTISQSNKGAVRRANDLFVTAADALLVRFAVVLFADAPAPADTQQARKPCTAGAPLNSMGGYWHAGARNVATPAPGSRRDAVQSPASLPVWVPHGCVVGTPELAPTPAQLWTALAGRRVLFIGDSLVRGLFLAFVDILSDYSLPSNIIGNELCRNRPGRSFRLNHTASREGAEGGPSGEAPGGAASERASHPGPNSDSLPETPPVVLICHKDDSAVSMSAELEGRRRAGRIDYMPAPFADAGTANQIASVLLHGEDTADLPYTDAVVNFGLHDVNNGVAHDAVTQRLRPVVDALVRCLPAASRTLWLGLWASNGDKKPYEYRWSSSHSFAARYMEATTGELARVGIPQLHTYDMSLALQEANLDGVHYSIKLTRPIAHLVANHLYESNNKDGKSESGEGEG